MRFETSIIILLLLLLLSFGTSTAACNSACETSLDANVCLNTDGCHLHNDGRCSCLSPSECEDDCNLIRVSMTCDEAEHCEWHGGKAECQCRGSNDYCMEGDCAKLTTCDGVACHQQSDSSYCTCNVPVCDEDTCNGFSSADCTNGFGCSMGNGVCQCTPCNEADCMITDAQECMEDSGEDRGCYLHTDGKCSCTPQDQCQRYCLGLNQWECVAGQLCHWNANDTSCGCSLFPPDVCDARICVSHSGQLSACTNAGCVYNHSTDECYCDPICQELGCPERQVTDCEPDCTLYTDGSCSCVSQTECEDSCALETSKSSCQSTAIGCLWDGVDAECHCTLDDGCLEDDCARHDASLVDCLMVKGCTYHEDLGVCSCAALSCNDCGGSSNQCDGFGCSWDGKECACVSCSQVDCDELSLADCGASKGGSLGCHMYADGRCQCASESTCNNQCRSLPDQQACAAERQHGGCQWTGRKCECLDSTECDERLCMVYSGTSNQCQSRGCHYDNVSDECSCYNTLCRAVASNEVMTNKECLDNEEYCHLHSDGMHSCLSQDDCMSECGGLKTSDLCGNSSDAGCVWTSTQGCLCKSPVSGCDDRICALHFNSRSACTDASCFYWESTRECRCVPEYCEDWRCFSLNESIACGKSFGCIWVGSGKEYCVCQDCSETDCSLLSTSQCLTSEICFPVEDGRCSCPPPTCNDQCIGSSSDSNCLASGTDEASCYWDDIYSWCQCTPTNGTCDERLCVSAEDNRFQCESTDGCLFNETDGDCACYKKDTAPANLIRPRYCWLFVVLFVFIEWSHV